MFDFGFATRLTPEKRVGSHEYQLTGIIGTQRYMAPEVACSIPYGTPADVYSFAIILWETLSLQAVYKNETRKSHVEKVYVQGLRPKIKGHWPRQLKQLLRASWSSNPSQRPSFVEIQCIINEVNG